MLRALATAALVWLAAAAPQPAADRVTTAAGPIEGAGAVDGVRSFKGIPFAAPPVGRLRWQAPQPVPQWKEVRPAKAFGNQCMQRRLFGDMVFRAAGMSEDCLYLNVWTPATRASERLPVLVYFYGGGFVAGDGSEPRYDGAALARRGLVTLTVNYRLNVFGFLAHPELSQESPRRTSGNYGLLDQVAALQWVRDNIAAFGGDPRKVTIAGESAGSISVSALMASPLSRGLIAGAIGESGAAMPPTWTPLPLAEAETAGLAFTKLLGDAPFSEVRALPADRVLEATAGPAAARFPIVIDGYFLPKTLNEIFAAGQQAQVPLLAGWNSQESGPGAVLGRGNPPTPENFTRAVRQIFNDTTDEALRHYPATTPEQVQQSATDLAGDRFIGFSTWKWVTLHGRGGKPPVYRYFYTRPRPAMRPEKGNAGPAGGAAHSAEIEYALGNLGTNEVYAWTPDDYKVSETFQGYVVNFVKTGNPNGSGLPPWPATNAGSEQQVLRIDVVTKADPDKYRERYLFLDRFYSVK
ncbi:MAG TPA: carboxylesterase family protein [Vicinamibacterales bacterium]|nr:carboxylesterase family protein [Vicinamibacterales bacterium]